MTDMPHGSQLIKKWGIWNEGREECWLSRRAKAGAVCVGCWSCLFIFLFSLSLPVLGLGQITQSRRRIIAESCTHFWKGKLCLPSLHQPLSADSDLDSCLSPMYAFHPLCSTSPNVCLIGTSHLKCVKYNFLSFFSLFPLLTSNFTL